MQETYEPWGKLKKSRVDTIYPDQNLFSLQGRSNISYLPHGLGRSYGDSCINSHGDTVHIATKGYDRFMLFDHEQGVLRCESGVSFASILQVIIPQGWFLPVTPGTKFVTIGGAIANDVHGKNHHVGGTIGCHVKSFELLRSDGSRLICTRDQNVDLFRATIGGLGLTGFVSWVELELKKGSAFFDVEHVKFDNIDQFLRISEESDHTFDYTVSWVDCLARGPQLGRGVFMRGNHSTMSSHETCVVSRKPKVGVPFEFPSWVLNSYSIRAFNEMYYRRFKGFERHTSQHFEPFFYPLDSIHNWNRIYGNKGFYQYQFVLPKDEVDALKSIFDIIAHSGQGSFLAVLKEFGSLESPGILSFPKAGYTLALDFANGGAKTLNLMRRLDEIVMSHSGRLYPAKDARMSSEVFKASFPQYQLLEELRDPMFHSDFWRRVVG